MIFLAGVPQQPKAHEHRVILRQQPTPVAQAPKRQQSPDEFEQICRLFGALSERDTGHTVVRVYRVVIERSHPQNGIGSSELAEMERLNRLTALHHLNRLVELGMLEKRGARYHPRNFDDIFDEFEKQAVENIRSARLVAKQLERQ